VDSFKKYFFGKKSTTKTYVKHKSFADLPDKSSYGYLVFSDGSYVIVNRSYEHEEALKQFGYDEYSDFFEAGGIRMVRVNTEFYIDGLINNSKSRTAVKTAKDICDFYNIEYKLQDASLRGF